MKRLKILFVFLVVFATSCEKIGENKEIANDLNSKFIETNDPYDYVFVNPHWELINDNYRDESGNIGYYYVNTNNTNEHKFEVKGFTKDCGDGGSMSYRGHEETTTKTGTDGIRYLVLTCIKDKDPKDCTVNILLDENKKPCSFEIISDCKK